jgi:hypothetical protein
MQDENKPNRHFTNEELLNIVQSAKKQGLGLTIDLYLLDYIKHCFLEDGQLVSNIAKLESALALVEDPGARKNITDVIASMECVRSEYEHYVKDVEVMMNGGYPEARD